MNLLSKNSQTDFFGTFSCQVAFSVAVHSYSPFSMVLSQFPVHFLRRHFLFFMPALIVEAPVLQVFYNFFGCFMVCIIFMTALMVIEWNSFC
jgi:hypothetical protein